MDKALSFEEAADKGFAVLLIPDSAGVYVPKEFVEGFREWLTTVDEEDRVSVESGPENEWYWESWDNILTDSEYRDKDDCLWHLHQDGDLWAVRSDVEIEWED